MENASSDIQSILASNDNNVMAAQIRTSRAQELNRILARNHAKDANNFPTGTKPNGSKYTHYNSDCANFVSQCYSAGGVNQDAIWKPYIGAWTRAFAGSIMYYPSSLTVEAHVGIITSNDGQTAYYSAHTTDHCNIKLGSMKTVLSYYIPVWDSYTGTWTPQ